jgi:hypothetical protein
MKEFLQKVKSIEVDFKSTNNDYQSKIELAVSSLLTGGYEKSRQMFDAAIELDSTSPAGWIGKSFAEIAFVADEEFNQLQIDEYINRALRKTDELMDYRAALCGCLIYRHLDLINKYEAKKKEIDGLKNQSQANQNLALGALGAGLLLSGNSKSVSSNIVGGALITGGIHKSIQHNIDMNAYKSFQEKLNFLILNQYSISQPVVNFARVFSTQIQTSSTKDNLNLVVEQWFSKANSELDFRKEVFIKSFNSMSSSDFIDCCISQKIPAVDKLRDYYAVILGSDSQEVRLLNKSVYEDFFEGLNKIELGKVKSKIIVYKDVFILLISIIFIIPFFLLWNWLSSLDSGIGFDLMFNIMLLVIFASLIPLIYKKYKESGNGQISDVKSSLYHSLNESIKLPRLSESA